ncbi:MAG TPA: LytTR family DNA-binding domain-containing protein [Lachnospiraceae bacterium]|nr:LytTR family DNA-binding domain-containing protein [Lachnospiraceae bacterium]
MKITIVDRLDDEEDEIIIRCRQMDEKLLKMIYTLRAGMDKITGIKGIDFVKIDPKDIFYFETVENKVFLYLEKEVYETKLKLYELEKRFEGTDFIRVSKSVILNLAKVKSLRPAFSGRYEACMKNGEIVVISRQYVPALKEKLGL